MAGIGLLAATLSAQSTAPNSSARPKWVSKCSVVQTVRLVHTASAMPDA
jgi:hypothetical protein